MRVSPKNNSQLAWQSAPSSFIGGSFAPPGDKSISQRAILFAALAKGFSFIENFLVAEDPLHTLKALQACGIDAALEGQSVRIQGGGLSAWSEPSKALDLGNSGTGFRLLVGILAAMPFPSVITGDASLRQRPMQRIIEPLTQMGACIQSESGYAPLHIFPRHLKPLHYALPIPSAQVKSCLLLAGIASGQPVVLEGALESRDHTERLLAYTKSEAFHLTIPGDFSSAAFFIAAVAARPNAFLRVEKVGLNPGRLGLLRVLQGMGADIAWEMEGEHPEPVGWIEIHGRQLQGIEIEMVADWIDEFPAFCIAAVMASGLSVIRGVAELRVKESDRVQAMHLGLETLHIPSKILEDGFQIEGKSSVSGGVINSFGDHRIAMAFLVLGASAKASVMVEGVECIMSSFPTFKTTANTLGFKINEYTRNHH